MAASLRTASLRPAGQAFKDAMQPDHPRQHRLPRCSGQCREWRPATVAMVLRWSRPCRPARASAVGVNRYRAQDRRHCDGDLHLHRGRHRLRHRRPDDRECRSRPETSAVATRRSLGTATLSPAVSIEDTTNVDLPRSQRCGGCSDECRHRHGRQPERRRSTRWLPDRRPASSPATDPDLPTCRLPSPLSSVRRSLVFVAGSATTADATCLTVSSRSTQTPTPLT